MYLCTCVYVCACSPQVKPYVNNLKLYSTNAKHLNCVPIPYTVLPVCHRNPWYLIPMALFFVCVCMYVCMYVYMYVCNGIVDFLLLLWSYNKKVNLQLNHVNEDCNAAQKTNSQLCLYTCIHVPKVITVPCDVSGCCLVVALAQPSPALH